MKILLLQARNPEDTAKYEERQSFADMAGLPLEAIVPHDLLTSAPTLAQIQQYDALMIGGSGDYYVSKRNLPHFEATLAVLQDVAEVGHPTFASCFGFQLLVQALGGEVVYAPEFIEVGTYPVKLTEAGANDPLFEGLPITFMAQLGRKDRAIRLPDSLVHLAGSQNAPYQAVRVIDKLVWGVQFHPELTRETNLARFDRYLAGYASAMSPTEIAETRARFVPSPEAQTLLPRFIELITK